MEAISCREFENFFCALTDQRICDDEQRIETRRFGNVKSAGQIRSRSMYFKRA